jgi:pilus assembly protein CpaB
MRAMAQPQTDLQPSRSVDGTSSRSGQTRRRGRRQLNPRQRQGALLLVVAAAGLIGVFVLIAGYVRNVSTQVGPKIQVLELNQTVQPYEQITSSMLSYVSLPAKWAPPNAMRSPGEAVGEVSDVTLTAGTELERGMLTLPPTLQANQEEIAIYVDAETGVAGQIAPGSQVAIVATFGASGHGKPSARVIVPVAKVIGVGTPTTTGGSGTGSSQPSAQGQVVPVTFALTPDEVLAVSYAESFAQKVRLALMAPGTAVPAPPQPYKPGL